MIHVPRCVLDTVVVAAIAVAAEHGVEDGQRFAVFGEHGLGVDCDVPIRHREAAEFCAEPPDLRFDLVD